MAKQFALLAQDPDIEVTDQHEDPASGVPSTDADVVKLGAVAQGEHAGLVDLVMAHPGVRGHRVLVGVRGRLLEPVECLSGRDHAPGRVGTLLVVVPAEEVDLGLELDDGCGRGLLSQPALQGLVESLDLPLGLGMVGPAMLDGDAKVASSVSKPQRPLRNSAVKIPPLSVSIEAGNPQLDAPW